MAATEGGAGSLGAPEASSAYLRGASSAPATTSAFVRGASPAPASPRVPAVPRATYRLQLHAGFDFAAATDLVPYLASLGISHLYSSPILQTAPGSTHGYDVVAPGRVNRELGGEAGFRRLVAALHAHGMGLVVDIVPNHMAITPENPWWWDVLENGRSSRYARTFDVDWEPPEPAMRDTILLPILADHYGRVLEAGELHLRRDGGSFMVTYNDQRLPLAPPSLDGLLGEAAGIAGSDELAAMADAFAALPPSTADDRTSVRRRHRDKEVLRGLLDRLLREQPAVAAAVDAVITAIEADPDRLDALLQRQNYRVAFWRAADRDLAYRRFFDVTSLAGLRVEDEAVFEETHEKILGWVRDGDVDGLRVDHPDGLRDPAEYLGRLRQRAATSWLVVEKILEPSEALRPWPVAGTTGYDFMRRVDGLFVDPRGREPLTRRYTRFVDSEATFPETAREAKLLVTRDILGSELNRLAALALRVCEGHRRERDHTRHDLHEALREICASFPVYRSYARAESGEITPEDREAVVAAIEDARAHRPDISPDLFAFLGQILQLEIRGPLESELVMRFQQFTGAVRAKGVEDTAFYRYLRLVSLNEVGGDPALFGVSVDEFHRANAAGAERWPAQMLASSTHDTKRGEDVRLRIHLLSEMPRAWSAAVDRWAALTERHRRDGVTDRATQWLLFQTLVGAWPIELERLQGAMLKSIREAKLLTSWTRPDETYEAGVAAYVERVHADRAFRSDLEAFLEPLVPAARATSLAATLLKLTAPGVPDIYQGTELPDNSLVDPDNRRPVDFALRAELLAGAAGLGPEEVLARWDDGLPKLWTIQRALRARAERPEAFGVGAGYRPGAAFGERAGHVVAFCRGEAAITIVPRLLVGLDGDWRDTSVEIPLGRWRDAMTTETWDGGRLDVGRVLARFPVALLLREPGPDGGDGDDAGRSSGSPA